MLRFVPLTLSKKPIQRRRHQCKNRYKRCDAGLPCGQDRPSNANNIPVKSIQTLRSGTLIIRHGQGSPSNVNNILAKNDAHVAMLDSDERQGAIQCQ